MKKNYLWAVLAGMVLAGCVSDENSPVGETQKLMTFDTPVFKTQSRAPLKGEISGIKYPESESFKVYAYSYTGSFNGNSTSDYVSYFNGSGEKATKSSDYWATEASHYWPGAAYNLLFVAYSPADATVTATHDKASGLKFTAFKTEDVSDNQYDLMYSNRYLDRNVSNNGAIAVPLVFNHALASIVFSTLRDESSPETVITKLEISGVFHITGDFDQNIKGEIKDGVYSEKATPKWDLKYTEKSMTYKPTFAEVAVPYKDPVIFTSGTSALLMIPQIVPDGAAVKIYYKTKLAGSDTYLPHEATINLKQFIQQTTGQPVKTWEMGKRYIYRISFGKTNRIYFEPSVVDWERQEIAIATITAS